MKRQLPAGKATGKVFKFQHRVIALQRKLAVCLHRKRPAEAAFGGSIEDKGIEASYVDGVLTVNVPKAEEIKPRQIKVN